MLIFKYNKNAQSPNKREARIMRLAPEEAATMGRLVISANNCVMTRGKNIVDNKIYDGSFVANYYFAEWLAVNYWRLRWEGLLKRSHGDWRSAHSMRSIGNGYVWPDITFSSDGERIALFSQSVHDKNSGGFEYEGAVTQIVRANEFDEALEIYVKTILDCVDKGGLKETNLQFAWQDIQEERNTPALAQKRCFEAILGYEPDEGDEQKIKSLAEMAERYNDATAREYAALAASRQNTSLPKAKIQGRWEDMASLSQDMSGELPEIGQEQAWKLGRCAAAFLRTQEKLGDGAINDTKLEEMAGVPRSSIVSKNSSKRSFSFLKKKSGSEKTEICLSGKQTTSQRFALARLLGDKILYEPQGNILEIAGNDSATYRQKAQKAFAAEFLCPIEPLKEYLSENYAKDNIDNAAKHFDVSPLTIEASLANHGLIARGEVRDIENEELLSSVG